ncbi:hypothetical protein [Polaribacter sp.]|uniref:hypothetical protein n=1 Tax=Polaribacter sp. TaxID=1920175 RepID=UPI003EF396B2
MKKLYLFTLCFYTCIGFAQNNSRYFLDDVRIQRSFDNFDGYVKLTYNLFDVQLTEKDKIEVDTIYEAVDNKGKKLTQIKTSYFSTNKKSFLIQLTQPSRGATSIKTVSGGLKYFRPTEENGAIITCKNSRSQLNKNILKNASTSAILKLIDIQKVEKLKIKSKEHLASHIDSLKKTNKITDAEIKMIQNISSFFSNKSGDTPTINFYKNDPKKEIIEINIYDEKHRKQSNGYYASNFNYNVTLKQAPKENWTIEVILESKKAITIIPFEFKNVFLP